LPTNIIAERTVRILQQAGIADDRKSRERRTLSIGHRPLRHRAGYLFAGAAAVLILMFGYTRLTAHAPTHAAVTTYTTANGQRANITLSDGSTVVLNVASRLEVPADFGASHRTVRLNGEALFTVARRTKSPFTVVTGQTTTRVLGTSFVVRRYTTDTATTVAVRDGKVAVQSTVVTAQHQATVNQRGGIHLSPASPAQFTFAKGVLTLNGVMLKDAIAELDRWYDADIRVEDPTLLRYSIHGTCTTGSLTDLSSILELTLDARVVRDGRTLTLFPK
jgi:ferric-dicitrate binding protein FerR (iron transport regulator)